MAKNIHLYPKNHQHVYVHRPRSYGNRPDGGNWWVKPAVYVGGGILVIYLISQILPYLIVAAVGYGAFQAFCRK